MPDGRDKNIIIERTVLMKRNIALLILIAFCLNLTFSGCADTSPKTVDTKKSSHGNTEYLKKNSAETEYSGAENQQKSPHASSNENKNDFTKIETVSKNDVIDAFNSLCENKGVRGYYANSPYPDSADGTVKRLGIIDNRYELYIILPEDASGNTVMTYGTLQGFTVVSGTRYSPSAFALYLFDTQNRVMYTIEDGERLIDFSKAYQLLPTNMKQ